MFARSLFIFLFTAYCASSFAQNRNIDEETADIWQLALSDQGIMVHFKERADNPLNEIKAETIVQGDMHAAFDILQDPMNILSADPYIKNAKKIGEGDSLGMYYYGEVQMPVLMKNRDFVIKAYTSRTSTGYFIAWKSMYDYLPATENLVRIKDITTMISLQQVSDNYYSLTYKISLAPEGGDMAINFANKALVESSFERLKAFRKLVSSVETPLAAEAAE